MVVWPILSSLIMIFILIIPGVFFKKKNILTEDQNGAINSIVVNLTWPCLVIDAMQMKFSLEVLKDSAYILVVCLLILAIIFAISFPIAKLIKLPKTKQYLTVFMLLFGNTGFIGIPVIKALYGTDAVFYAAIVELINDILIFTVGILLIQLSAVKSAINNTGKIILQDHIEHCIVDAVEHGDKDAIKELERAIDRFMK